METKPPQSNKQKTAVIEANTPKIKNKINNTLKKLTRPYEPQITHTNNLT